MTIDIHRGLNGGMAHLLFDVMQGFALLEKQGSESVPDVVETDVRQIGLLEIFIELTPTVAVHIDRASVGFGEDQTHRLAQGVLAG